MSLADRVYARAPRWAQEIGITVYGLLWRRRRFGGVFNEQLEQFTTRERYSADQWADYQASELRRLLAFAIAYVPHYRAIASSRGLRGGDVESFSVSALRSLPLLTKEDIRSEPAAFLSDSPERPQLHSYLSSGTTGTPLAFRFSSAMHQTWSAAYERRCRQWAGVDRTMSRAMIGGRLVVPRAEASPPFWRYNAVERQLYMSAFHISPATAPAYVGALNRYAPDYLVGYASSHFFLARMIVEGALRVHRPRAVLTSSENLTPEMRATIEQAYGCRVYDAYSGVEACCLSSECEAGSMHLSPDVGVFEILRDDGGIAEPGETGEIVATGLLNFHQPLIRYRTGDYAAVSTRKCDCGRAMPVVEELVGRLEDVVIGRDGREMVRFHGIFVGLEGVREGQVIQESLDRLRVLLVVDSAFGNEDRARLLERFRQRLGDVRVDIEIVDEIPRTERGKFRAVISKVKRQRVLQS